MEGKGIHHAATPAQSLALCSPMAPKKKQKIAFQKWREGNDKEAGRLFSRRWGYLMCYAMLEYCGIRLVERRTLLSLKDRVLIIVDGVLLSGIFN